MCLRLDIFILYITYKSNIHVYMCLKYNAASAFFPSFYFYYCDHQVWFCFLRTYKISFISFGCSYNSQFSMVRLLWATKMKEKKDFTWKNCEWMKIRLSEYEKIRDDERSEENKERESAIEIRLSIHFCCP